MSSNPLTTESAEAVLTRPGVVARSRRVRRPTALAAHGEPYVWLTGGALTGCLIAIVGLLLYVFLQGVATFWPGDVVKVRLVDGRSLMGEISTTESYRPEGDALVDLAADPVVKQRLEANNGVSVRTLLRTGNAELTGTHFEWVNREAVEEETRPEWAMVLERLTWGRFYGELQGFEIDEESKASTPEEAWKLLQTHLAEVIENRAERRRIQRYEIGELNTKIERGRLLARQAELDYGDASPEAAEAKREQEQLELQMTSEITKKQAELTKLVDEAKRYRAIFETSDGATAPILLEEVVRAYAPNRLSWSGRWGVYASRWGEFLFANPRQANTEGGVFPALVGTVVMTLLLSVAVVPFGVLAALYLREYAKNGWVVSAIRIAINNLAGVPSIVFGVFGLGFFCYVVGGAIDERFFAASLPSPTFGKGGVLWASLTLALLTAPVVIVATEEALSAVPNSMREGSYACGASKWQTIRRIVLPRALPGIMTGMILAMARGAGEVAPLMLVGAVKLAQELPVDTEAPFFHPDRSFMHLGSLIYDLGFQSQNSEAAKPMVFTITLLLILVVGALNLSAVWLRTRLRKRFASGHF